MTYICEIKNDEELLKYIKNNIFINIIRKIIKYNIARDIILKLLNVIYSNKIIYCKDEECVVSYGFKVNLIFLIYNKKNLEHLKKKLIEQKVKHVVLSKELKENIELKKTLKSIDIDIIDGRILYEVLIEDMIKYIFKITGLKMEESEISILINKLTYEREKIINYLAKRFKIVSIVTENKNKFENLKSKIKIQYGNILNVIESLNMGIKRADVIINYDIEKIGDITNLRDNIVVFNIDTKERINSNYFSGINIRDYEIYIPEIEKIFYKKYEDKFYISDMYESICVCENLTMSEISNKAHRDKIKIRYFIGNNGKIKGMELKNINAKKN